jgi:ABC-2 type transport system ATP-binding protein
MLHSIATEKLVKSFGKNSILNGISLHICAGTVYGLVGLNGAGKTTLLRLLLGILRPDQGNISILDYDPWKHEEALYRRIGVVLENDGFWGNLTIKENIRIFAAAKKINWTDAEKYFIENWRETPLYNNEKRVKYLSRGQRMQCALCRAFLGWPEVYFFDEPSIALDVTANEHFRKMVKKAKERGASMIISSHQLDTIDSLCDRAGNLINKQLSDIQNSADNRNSSWVLVSGDMEIIGEIISSAGGKSVRCEGQNWRFEIQDADSTIPVLVAQLVGKDLPVKEIRKESQAFSDTIKMLYSPENTKGLQNE